MEGGEAGEERELARLSPAAVHVMFAAVLCVTVVLSYRTMGGAEGEGSKGMGTSFARFQLSYLVVYLLMVAGDWLQGPYMFALYAAYGYTHDEIAALFVAGFGSSMIFGTFVGSLADSMGRKRGALLYVATYALSCVTKHWKTYWVLMVGRILGGVATSLLFSVFESWLVSEHERRGFEPSSLGTIFANAQSGNSIVAILAGVAGEWASNLRPLRPVAAGVMVGGYATPFDLAALVLCVGGLIVAATWTENYGGAAAASLTLSSSLDAFRLGLADLAADPRILLIGLVSAAFEAAMYAFVFEWTPALTVRAAPPPPYGEIFSVMMLCCTCGTRVFGIAQRYMATERTMHALILLSAAALTVPAVLAGFNPLLCLLAFLLFEIAVGVYFPAVATLKSRLVPDTRRSTIYNLFRVPLNVLVLVVLLARMTSRVIFTTSVLLLAAAAAMQHRLCKLLAISHHPDDPEQAPLQRP